MYGARRGFTLVEMIVAVGIFAIVMTVIMTTLVSVMAASNRAGSTQVATDNLSFALDTMSRSIRYGYHYYCTDEPIESGVLPADTQDCADGGMTLIFTNTIGGTMRAGYRLAERDGVGVLEMITRDSGAWIPITSESVDIESARFFVQGSMPGVVGIGDGKQPSVRFILSARPVADKGTIAPFHLQTTMTQRAIDVR